MISPSPESLKISGSQGRHQDSAGAAARQCSRVIFLTRGALNCVTPGYQGAPSGAPWHCSQRLRSVSLPLCSNIKIRRNFMVYTHIQAEPHVRSFGVYVSHKDPSMTHPQLYTAIFSYPKESKNALFWAQQHRLNHTCGLLVVCVWFRGSCSVSASPN